MTVAGSLIGPSGRPFTDEQAAAVLRREGDLLLSAAAGSGKTSVLVERFVRLVTEDGFKLGQILAITFTEKAAGELRHRVRSRLLELGERDLAREAEGAWISTIHGFCARLLRGHAVAAGLDPAFAVLDETVARTLRNAAWDSAFASWLSERGDAALDLAAAFTADRLREAIEDVYGVLRSEGHTHPRLPVPEPAPVPDPSELLAAREVALGSLDGGDTRATVLKALRALERCREVFAALASGAVPDPGSLAQACFKPGSTKALKTEEIAGYLAAHEAYAGGCAAYRSSRAAAELDALLDRYASAYAEAKRARSGLDFDDLELLARDLMVESPAVRRATQERFARVMVDEFQDSSPRQVTLFDLVASGNLFVVGDELQSIYGFRHADVEVFRSRRAMLTTTDRALALTRNFRSRAPVLEAVNAAFADRFGAGFLPLVPGRADAADGAPEVEVLITGADGWEGVDLGGLPRAQAWRHAEARLLGQRLKELVDGGTPPEDIVVLLRSATDLPVYERALEEAGLQTLAAGGRGYWGRQVVRDLCAWLAALANPGDEEQLYGVLASPLVGLSTDALALIAGAGEGRVWQTIDAAFGGAPVPPPAAAPKPPTPATDAAPPADPAPSAADDPSAARELRAFLRARELAERLPELLPPADRERLAAFRARFAHERRVLPSLPMDAVLRRAIEASDYDLHVLRLPGGARRLANVHKLLRLTADHERVHGRDVRGLVDRANEELEADARETDAPVELGDARAIRIMTMHAAKGLEFPVVAVADLGRGPRGQYPPVLVGDGRLGIRLPSVGGGSEEGLAYGELREERRTADAAEEDRVLYVALTRARERLILSGALRLDPWPDPSRATAAPLAWLAPALAGSLSPIVEGLAEAAAATAPAPAAAAAPADAAPPAAAAPAAAAPLAGTALSSEGRFAGQARFFVSTPETVGQVLRRESLAPAGADLPLAPPPPARPPVPLPEGPPPSVRGLSYTALSLWRKCGYRFYLQRVLRLPEEEDARPAAREASGRLDPRIRGSIAHAALEREGDPRALTTEAAKRYGVELSAEELDDIGGLVAAYATTPYAARVEEAGRVRREHTFSFALGGTMLTGVVDLLAHEADGTALVLDYKTDRIAAGDTPDQLVARDYDVQQRLYALAVLRSGAPGVEVAYLFLERPDEPVSRTFTPEDVPRLESELHALAQGITDGRYEVAPNPHIGLCAGCPGRRALCVHPEELTGRERPDDPPVGAVGPEGAAEHAAPDGGDNDGDAHGPERAPEHAAPDDDNDGIAPTEAARGDGTGAGAAPGGAAAEPVPDALF